MTFNSPTSATLNVSVAPGATTGARGITVTNTPGAIIHWQSFSIDRGELTRFVQQNAASAVLNRITGIVAQAGANIDEVHHQRAFSPLPAQNVEVELVLQTRNLAHVNEVLAALTQAGFSAKAY